MSNSRADNSVPCPGCADWAARQVYATRSHSLPRRYWRVPATSFPKSVSLAVLDHDKPLFIARAEAEHILSTGVRVGAHLPAYCSATGRVLLSQFSDEEIAERLGPKPFHPRTPHTITKLTPLLAEIRAVHKRGYAMSDEELELGMRALAVPAFDETDAIIGAISVSAASARVRAADLRNQFLPVLQSCARALRNAMARSAVR